MGERGDRNPLEDEFELAPLAQPCRGASSIVTKGAEAEVGIEGLRGDEVPARGCGGEFGA